MAIWIRFVDPRWYDFVSTRPALDEVNLWTAPGRGGLDGAETGDLVLFRVRGRRGVAGYGTFFHAAIYWADDAWDIFKQRNGALTREAFVDQIKAQRTGKGLTLYAVACHDIVQPTWFDRLRARLPEEALQRLGSGPIEEESPDGRLLLRFLEQSESASFDAAIQEGLVEPKLRSGRSIRPGEAGFRMAVRDAYGRTCAITEEAVLPCLEAAHIIPDWCHGPLIVQNAVLLRRDLHPLFERGYLTISIDHRVVVSAWLPRDYERCQTYLAFNNKQLVLPKNRDLWPDPGFLEFHRAGPFFKGGALDG